MLVVGTYVRAVYDPTAAVAIPDVSPSRAHASDAAFDLYAANRVKIEAGHTKVVPTGVSVAIPEGFCGLVLPRSSLYLKHGLDIPNSPGLIDAGYRGEIGLILRNPLTFKDMYDYKHGVARRYVETIPGERYAQLLFVRVEDTALVPMNLEAYEALTTERGVGGFGSTG